MASGFVYSVPGRDPGCLQQETTSAVGNPYANAQAESFMETFKAKEVYIRNYETFAFADATVRLLRFIEHVYTAYGPGVSIKYGPSSMELIFCRECVAVAEDQRKLFAKTEIQSVKASHAAHVDASERAPALYGVCRLFALGICFANHCCQRHAGTADAARRQMQVDRKVG
jgi:hypothetical protein